MSGLRLNNDQERLLEADAVTQTNAQLAALHRNKDRMNYYGQLCKHYGGKHESSTCLTNPFVHPGVDDRVNFLYK